MSDEGSGAPEEPPRPPEPRGDGRASEAELSGPELGEPVMKGSNVRYSVMGVDGKVIGCIVVNKAGTILDAHCYRHHGKRPCSINRTYNRPIVKPKGSTQHRGRPLGFLVAWLRAGYSFPAGPDHRNEHFECSKCQDDFAYLENGRGPQRQSARAWASANLPDDLEAPKWDGESDEPLGRV